MKSREMVRKQLRLRGITDERVLEAFTSVPRHLFVPRKHRDSAYSDAPLPIGHGQTISQPYIAALMTQLLEIKPGERVLEVGTGSGYQTAILAFMGAKVYTVERKRPLLDKAAAALSEAGVEGVNFREGDGSLGWEKESPFDGIIVAAGAPGPPSPLLEQLKPGGRLVIPVGGSGRHELMVYLKEGSGKIRSSSYGGCMFVPLVGEHGEKQ